MSATSSLLTELKANAAIAAVVGDEVYQNVVPEDKPGPYIWFATSGQEQMETMGPDAQVLRHFVDLECVSLDVDQALDLADTVRQQLGLTPAGSFGTGHIAGISVSDQTDEYVPRNPAADEGQTVAALSVELILYEE